MGRGHIYRRLHSRRACLHSGENRRSVGMLSASEDVDIYARAPYFAELMLKDESGEEVARVAGLRNPQNRELRAASVFGEVGAIELDPARRPTHGRVSTADIVGSHRKRARGECV